MALNGNRPQLGIGRVVRWFCVNFQCRGVLLILIIGQRPFALAVGAGGGYLCFFSVVCLFFFSFSHPVRRPDIDGNIVSKGP